MSFLLAFNGRPATRSTDARAPHRSFPAGTRPDSARVPRVKPSPPKPAKRKAAGKAPRGKRAPRRSTGAPVSQSELQLRAILDTAVEGIITIDEQGRIQAMNRAAERIFGWKSPKVMGKNVSMFMPSPYKEMHDRFLSNYIKSGEAKIIGIGREVVGLRRDGTVFPMDLAVSEVRTARRRLFTGFVRDLTERRRLEAEVLEISEQERRRIGQDLHDGICQQLAGLALVTHSMEERLRKARRPEADQIARCRDEIAGIIAETRRLARGLCPVVLESEGLMAALDELARSTHQPKRLNCRFECPTATPLGDSLVATHLYRIAQEAVNNAIKHSGAKTITITLSHADEGLHLTVTDDGSGLPDSFSPNAGMGLHIMQYRARLLGGTLAVRPANPKGTSVTCVIPTLALEAKKPR